MRNEQESSSSANQKQEMEKKKQRLDIDIKRFGYDYQIIVYEEYDGIHAYLDFQGVGQQYGYESEAMKKVPVITRELLELLTKLYGDNYYVRKDGAHVIIGPISDLTMQSVGETLASNLALAQEKEEKE